MSKIWIENENGCSEPLIQINEEEDEIIISADLPCVNKEDIKIFCTEQTLEIHAKITKYNRFEKWGTLNQEITFKYFKRSINLSTKILKDKVKANFKNGILILRLPKNTLKTQIYID
tara:strand:+ start:1505 stop:1855 length:351 start_codon:yes stop_codon:yes gene_type:complete